MGHITQQLPLASKHALQALPHAVEIRRQHAQFVLAAGQLGQATLLVGGFTQLVHGMAQAHQRTGDGKC